MFFVQRTMHRFLLVFRLGKVALWRFAFSSPDLRVEWPFSGFWKVELNFGVVSNGGLKILDFESSRIKLVISRFAFWWAAFTTTSSKISIKLPNFTNFLQKKKNISKLENKKRCINFLGYCCSKVLFLTKKGYFWSKDKFVTKHSFVDETLNFWRNFKFLTKL